MPAIGRQAVHEDRLRVGQGHHVGVDRVALELLQAFLLLGFLTHRHPRVGVHGMGAFDGLGRAGRLLDRCRPEQAEPFEFRRAGRRSRAGSAKRTCMPSSAEISASERATLLKSPT